MNGHPTAARRRSPERSEDAPVTSTVGTDVADRGPLRGGLRPATWRRGRALVVPALLLGLFLELHPFVPNRVGHLGSLAETFLPWSGLAVPVLLVGALRRRSASATLAVLVPVVAWLHLFGGTLGDRTRPGGDLTVVEHNVGAGNPDPAGTARDLAASRADVLALVELSGQARGTYEQALERAYPFHTVQGTVGLWSTLPLSDTRPVDIRMDYGPLAATKPFDPTGTRALRTTVATSRGPLVVYVAHLASVRVNPRAGFGTDQRDRGVQALEQAITAEPNPRVVLLGDLNGTADDRAFAGLLAQVRSAQDAAGAGFGLSWPAGFPLLRIDQILVRGVEPDSAWVLPATGSDHLPVAARLSW